MARLGLPAFAAISLGGDDGLAGSVAELEGGCEIGLADLLGGAFEHDHLGLAAHVHQVEVALRALRMGGVGHELAVDTSDPDRAQRAGPRDVADHERRRGADDAQNVRIVLAIAAQQDALHLDLIEPPLREERPNGPVGHAAGEDFLFRRGGLRV